MSTHAETLQQPALDLTPADRPDHTLIAIVLLAILAMAGIIALLPSPEEKAAALVAEQRYDEAIQMLVALEQQHGLNDYEGFLLSQLYVLVKQPEKATGLLEAEASTQADNGWALRQLVVLYRQGGRFSDEASTLGRLYDEAGKLEDFQRLRVLYRLMGDTQGESSLLVRAVALGQADQLDIARLETLKARSASGSQSVLWTSGSGPFELMVQNPQTQVLAATKPTPSAIIPE